MFAWFKEAPQPAKRSLLAASLGWMLDSFDIMLYSLVLVQLMSSLHLSKAGAGAIGSATLIAAAAGGVVFGAVADRYGRVSALRWSILMYAVFTAACGLAQNAIELLIFRVLLGFGMGGEWASGACLVSETWPAADRGKALGLMQSSWAIGYALAAMVSAAIVPFGGWRAVFFVGIVPALLTFWMRRKIAEEKIRGSTRSMLDGLAGIFRAPLFRPTAAITLMNACALFAWWGFNLWVPAYLQSLGLGINSMTGLIVAMQIGMWFGYIVFGYAGDGFGLKGTYVSYLLMAAAALVLYSLVRAPLTLLLLGPVVAFFATGHFSGLGAITARIYSRPIRATAQGFTYNVGRLASAAAPFTVGSWATTHGFASAFRVAACFFWGSGHSLDLDSGRVARSANPVDEPILNEPIPERLPSNTHPFYILSFYEDSTEIADKCIRHSEDRQGGRPFQRYSGGGKCVMYQAVRLSEPRFIEPLGGEDEPPILVFGKERPHRDADVQIRTIKRLKHLQPGREAEIYQ